MNIKQYITFSFLFAPFSSSTDKRREILSLFALSAITLKTYSIAATIR